MPAAARLGDYCTGHGCWPPRTGVTASPNVIINGIRAHRLNDTWNIHCCPKAGCHPGAVASGSASVFINGRPAARIGDSISCGSYIAMGSPNVSIGSQSRGGGRNGAGSLINGAIGFAEDYVDGYVEDVITGGLTDYFDFDFGF
jgi:uncharacterized Zn-binding protein involved in type VI secretion